MTSTDVSTAFLSLSKNKKKQNGDRILVEITISIDKLSFYRLNIFFRYFLIFFFLFKALFSFPEFRQRPLRLNSILINHFYFCQLVTNRFQQGRRQSRSVLTGLRFTQGQQISRNHCFLRTASHLFNDKFVNSTFRRGY